MIGYNKKEIFELEQLDSKDFEPILPDSLTKKIIMIISLVNEKYSFSEIAKELKMKEISLKRNFLEMPTLPRPFDWNKKFPDEKQPVGSQEDMYFEYDNQNYYTYNDDNSDNNNDSNSNNNNNN